MRHNKVANPVDTNKDTSVIVVGSSYDFWDNEGDNVYDKLYGEQANQSGRNMDGKR